MPQNIGVPRNKRKWYAGMFLRSCLTFLLTISMLFTVPAVAFAEEPDRQPEEACVPEAGDSQTAGLALLIKGLDDTQISTLGGIEKLTKELEAFLAREQFSVAHVATLLDYCQETESVHVLFELDDNALSKLELVFTCNSYTFAWVLLEDSGYAEDGNAGYAEDGNDASDADDEEDVGVLKATSESNVKTSPGTGTLQSPTAKQAAVAHEEQEWLGGTQLFPLEAAPTTLVGRFTLTPNWYCNAYYMGGFPGTVTLNSNYTVVSFGSDSQGGNGLIPCITPGAANWGDPQNANNRSGILYARFVEYDQAHGIAWYWIERVVPDIQPADQNSVGVQYLGQARLGIKWNFEGNIELYKTSANSGITNGNNNYTLFGAQYGVYASKADAIANANQVIRLNTDATGYAKSTALPFGTYYAKELRASQGYELDQTVYTIRIDCDTISSMGAVRLDVKERPHADSLVFEVFKLDASVGAAYGADDPRGTELAGAEFTIRYYAGYYSTVAAAEASGTLKKTWVVKTGVGGRAALAPEFLVSGSAALYVDSAGKTTIPLGTILVQETTAPSAYLLPTPNPINVQQIRFDSTLNKVVRLNAGDNSVAAPIKVSDSPREAKLIKRDAHTKELLSGAVFEIYQQTVTGDWKLKWTKTTDEQGSLLVSPIAMGNYKAIEIKAPEGYLLPIDVEHLFTIEKSTRLYEIEVLNYRISLEKLDKDTAAPVSNTEFVLYQYPVEIKNGLVVSDVSEIAANDPLWIQIATVISDDDGKAVCKGLWFGYYKLVESRPNPLYAGYEESGGVDRFFLLDKFTEDEVQVFEDELIQTSCTVYKNTIAITSSALDGVESGVESNVGSEEFLVHFGSSSTANVWADEFMVEDNLSPTAALGYRLTTLWTGTSPISSDFDGVMTILYRTNYSSASYGISPLQGSGLSYDLMNANPSNPNNPDRAMVWGYNASWRIWAEEVSIATQQRLDVADLGLAYGEHITGLRILYGGVEQGFFVGSAYAAGYEDFSYALVATEGLVPSMSGGVETVICSSIKANIARNAGVLRGEAIDQVETRVITPFLFPSGHTPLVWEPTPTRSPSPPPTAFPQTGDCRAGLAAAALVPAALGVVFLLASMRKQRASKTSRKLAENL